MITCQGQLPKAFARALLARGYRRLTPVQRAVLRVEAADADLLVSARTGSGKTVAFGLALARRLVGPDGRVAPAAGPRALVVTPTRELAMQVRSELGWLFEGTGARVGCLIGGADRRAERAALAAGLDLVVGTPGRLGDHLADGALEAGSVGCVVLDEADDMLEPGFRAELDAVLGALPPGRQTLLFSATMGPEVETLARRVQRGALRLDIGGPAPARGWCCRRCRSRRRTRRRRSSTCSGCTRRRRRSSSAAGARRWRGSRGGWRGAASGGRAVGRLEPARGNAGGGGDARRARPGLRRDRPRGARHGPAGARPRAACRPPGQRRALLHRCGRTGRAGRAGLAILVVPPGQRRRARALIARAGLAAEWIAPPGPAEVAARDVERMLEAVARPGPGAAAAVARLLAAHRPERIAAAFARLWGLARPAPAELGGRRRPA